MVPSVMTEEATGWYNLVANGQHEMVKDSKVRFSTLEFNKRH
jgi:hypothetical protein